MAPLVIICLYLYFHLYLDNLWEGLSSLPAIFPDGKRLDQRAYPWLLNTLVRKHFKRLQKRSFIARMKEWITIFLAWWVVPITMIAFWLRYIPRHEWWGTGFHIGLIVFSVAFAIIFYRLCALTLQGKEKIRHRFLYFWKDRRFYYGVGLLLFGVFISLLSYGAINVNRYTDFNTLRKGEIDYLKIKGIIPWAFEKLGYNIFTDFREKRVSEIPLNYGQIAKEERLGFVKGANLKGRNLKNADMYRAFLVKADLRGSLLNGSIIQGSDLRQANLEEANLHEANLDGANLQKAILLNANLFEAFLRSANFQQANLYEANLQKAVLLNANLSNAFLRKASLKQAYLLNANLSNADLSNANLQKATLLSANLQETSLVKANLQQAKLFKANLKQANLNNSDLRGAEKLTIDQLSKVKTLYKANLDPDLMKEVIVWFPHLLEEPKKEKEIKNSR